MMCSVDIIPALIKLKFDDHDLLLLKYVRDDPYEYFHTAPGVPIQRIIKPWASDLDKSRLLGLINMCHFGYLNEAHACVKKLLACFHGGTLWLNKPIPVIVDLIASITGLLKAREDPTQYICGRDTDKKLAKQLKERFGLQWDGHAYRINSINSQTVHIGTRIIASNVLRGN